MRASNEPEDSDDVVRPGGRAAPLTWPVMMLWLIAITAVLTVTGVVLDRETRLSPFLVFLPTLISGLGTVRQTVVASVWAIVLITGSLFTNPLDTAASNASVVAFAVALSGLSVFQAVQRISREGEITRLRSSSAALQRQILRPFPITTDELVVHGLYEPLEEDSRVGGDVYEAVATPYGTRVFIADVQGKGLPAISAAFTALSSFREAAVSEPTLTGVVDVLENSVLRHNSVAEQAGEAERFVTALVLSIGPEPEVRVINCGHVPPYLLHTERPGRVSLGRVSVPLGLASLAPEPRTAERFDFPYGSTLLLCTDGVTEARDPSGSFYPLEERLAAWGDVPPEELAPTVLHELRQYTQGSWGDDTALLVLRRKPLEPPAGNAPPPHE